MFDDWSPDAIPITALTKDAWAARAASFDDATRRYAAAIGFEGKPGQILLAPTADGAIGRVWLGVEPGAKAERLAFGKLATALSAGLYRLDDGLAESQQEQAALAFLLGRYTFSRYKAAKKDSPRLCAPSGCDRNKVERIANAIYIGRDLVNTPANDMGPEALAQAALDLANKYVAQTRCVVGDELLANNFPLIHAVGRGAAHGGAAQAPRLVEFYHGPEDGLKVTLVGKGVCFDTGGLDIKPGAAMLLMKKDMGGAATALALASMLMATEANIRLRVILPIVENSVSAPAYRPGDVYPSRKGVTVEIGDTDAEGRLVLADALALASEQPCDLLFDFATLTGAARVALGAELPPFFTGDDRLAAQIDAAARESDDPVWRLPLWDGYDSLLDGKIADLCNVASGGGMAGSITAALFLRRFVADPNKWAHFDVYCWNPTAKPGRPEGGEIQAARALYELIVARSRQKSAS